MMPRFKAMVTAWVRSFAPSFESILLMWALTVSSEMARWSATILAAELGYEVTMVKDATADYSDEMMHAALHLNIPNYASAVVTTKEIVESLSSL
jgi:hypothetical protein